MLKINIWHDLNCLSAGEGRQECSVKGIMRLMRYVVAVILLETLVFPAFQARAGEDASLILRYGDCQRITAYRQMNQMEDGNGAEYREGVDAHGRPVPPATLYPERRIFINPESRIRLTIPLRALLPALTPLQGGEADLVIGDLEIDIEGNRVFLNGKRLDKGGEAALIAACQEALKRQ